MRQQYHECPQCGHERVQRRLLTQAGEPGVMQDRVWQWLCGLCSYTWKVPDAARDDGDWADA